MSTVDKSFIFTVQCDGKREKCLTVQYNGKRLKCLLLYEEEEKNEEK